MITNLLLSTKNHAAILSEKTYGEQSLSSLSPLPPTPKKRRRRTALHFFSPRAHLPLLILRSLPFFALSPPQIPPRQSPKQPTQIPGVPIMYLSQHRYSIERLPEATIGGAPRT